MISDSLPYLWTAPDNIFKSVKEHLPPIEILTANISWKSGNEEALFTQDANHTRADMCTVVPFPYEWTTKVICDDKTASQTLTYVYSLTFEWATAELEAIQTLIDWLRAASCKAKASQNIQRRHRFAQTGQCPIQIARKVTWLEQGS